MSNDCCGPWGDTSGSSSSPNVVPDVSADPGSEGNWLGCIPWDGHEANLPLGGIIQDPNTSITDFIKSGKGVAIKIDEDLYKAMIETYGPRGVLIRSGAGQIYTREEWRAYFKTDGLKLWAIMEQRRATRVSKMPRREPLRLGRY